MVQTVCSHIALLLAIELTLVTGAEAACGLEGAGWTCLDHPYLWQSCLWGRTRGSTQCQTP